MFRRDVELEAGWKGGSSQSRSSTRHYRARKDRSSNDLRQVHAVGS